MFGRLLRHQKGATVVEFAIVAPILFAMVFGCLEFGYAAFAKSAVENAAREAARIGITGDQTREQAMQARAMEIMRRFPLKEGQALTIESRVYRSFDEVDQPEPWVDTNDNDACDAGETYQDINGNSNWDEDMARAGLGGPGEIVAYTIRYPARAMFGLFDFYLNEDGALELTGTTVVRNEPYGRPSSPSASSQTC